jgi:hypothetical protein
MKTYAYLSLSGLVPVLALAVAPAPASAAPVLNQPLGITHQLVESVRRDCAWVDNKWTYQRGDKRLVCRPDRPSGRGWSWHREGNRFGWYLPREKRWNHNAW